jgi:BirA family biotin operon repressor/biotin-[acetyl-CoA-carboxylase] ligase
MNLLVFETIDSTNTYVKNHADNLPSGTIVRARYQTQGRGQFSRSWESSPNDNLLFTLLLKAPFPEHAIQTLEKIAIESLISFLKTYGVEPLHKLPNDIYVQGKKIAGMLLETKHEGATLTTLILGIGLNVNQQSFTNLPNASSLALLTQKTYDIDSFAQAFFTIFIESVKTVFVVK